MDLDNRSWAVHTCGFVDLDDPENTKAFMGLDVRCVVKTQGLVDMDNYENTMCLWTWTHV